MQQTNDELWRVQLGTGEIRTMDLDALDRAFDEGLIDAHAPVLAPGAARWSTLGEVAGLDAPPANVEQTPSLSPVAISDDAPSSEPDRVAAERNLLGEEDPGEFDLDELALRSRRRAALVIGAVASAAVALAGLAFLVGQLGGADDVKATSAVQAPRGVMPLPAPKESPSSASDESRLSDEQKQKLLDADKTRDEKARAKPQPRQGDKAPAGKRRTPPKSNGPFINGGDRFDPLNGAL